MSTLPYLQKLRKAQLVEFAEITDLQDYEDDTKPELATKLDDHLQANRSIFNKDDRLADYYRRSSPALSSPVKRGSKASRSSSTPVKTESVDSAPPKSARRRAAKAREEAGPGDVPASAPSQPLIDVAVRGVEAVTPARPLLDAVRGSGSERTPAGPVVEVATPRSLMPPSPAVVTEAIERQTTKWRESIGDAWGNSGVQERTNSVRTALSSVKAVEVIVTLLEAFSLIKEILPFRYLATIPAIDALHTSALPVKIPDLFVLLEGSFWSPFSLWLLTSLIVPLSAAYFFNISLQVATSNANVQTRRSSSATRALQATFDPLTFNVVKAIITYIVYAHGFTFWNIYGREALFTVNASIPFQYSGILTGAAIGAVGTLYEAILRK